MNQRLKWQWTKKSWTKGELVTSNLDPEGIQEVIVETEATWMRWEVCLGTYQKNKEKKKEEAKHRLTYRKAKTVKV